MIIGQIPPSAMPDIVSQDDFDNQVRELRAKIWDAIDDYTNNIYVDLPLSQRHAKMTLNKLRAIHAMIDESWKCEICDTGSLPRVVYAGGQTLCEDCYHREFVVHAND